MLKDKINLKPGSVDYAASINPSGNNYFKEETLTNKRLSGNDKVLKKLMEFLNDERYAYGEFIVKRQDGKPMFIEAREKTKV